MRKVEKGCRKLEEDAPPTLTAPIKVKVAELDQLFKDLREMCRLVTAFQDIVSTYLFLKACTRLCTIVSSIFLFNLYS